MEVDELLSRFHDDAFEAYRDALRDASTASSVLTSSTGKKRRQKEAAPAAGPLSDPASLPSGDGKKTILRPEYERISRIKHELVQSVRHLSTEHAAQERRILVADDDEFAREKRKLDDSAKQLLDAVARLSNLLAYEVLLTRQIPESRARKETRAAEDALSRRAQALSTLDSLVSADGEDRRRSQKKTDSLFEEADDLYREAARHVQESRQVWPGRYDYVVIKPPRQAAAASVAASTNSKQKNAKKPKKPPASPLL